MRITAAVVRARGEPFSIEEVNLDEEPRVDEVLVRVRAVGLCHTDIAVRQGHYDSPLPAVLGHEGAGVVERVGESVRGVSAGDHVVMTFASCGACAQCLASHRAYCASGHGLNFGGLRADGTTTHRSADGGDTPLHGRFFQQSSFATHAVAQQSNIVVVPRDLPFHLLAPLGCSVQTGAGAMRVLGISRGDSVVILGVGGVGLSAVMAARALGCAIIIAVDVLDNRLALALTVGATHTLHASDDLGMRLKEVAPQGLDAALDTTGSPQSVAVGLQSLARRGRCGVVGTPPSNDEGVFVRLGELLPGRSLRGIIQGDSEPASFLPELIEWYRRGELPLDRITTTYPLHDINSAEADVRRGIVGKAVLLVDS